MVDPLGRLDATAQAELVRGGVVTPIELVEAAIARIERHNPQLNAVITPLFDEARAAATAPDLPNGPFRGVPLLLKDYLCEVAGTPYTEGLGVVRDRGWRSRHDTYLAAKFRAAGFVFLGKTNLPELAGGPITDSQAFGPARNPWDRLRTAGGSSGGSAAAVAAGLVPLAHGNDGTGSLRGPASCCGLVGLKPSRGRVSLGPERSGGFFGNVCEHVLTRSLRDAAAVLDAVAGPMPGDVFAAPPPARPFVAELGRDPGSLRVGLLLHDPLLEGLRAVEPDLPALDPECVAAVVATGRLLEGLGHAVVEAYPPALDGPTGFGPALRILATSGVAAALERWTALLGRSIGLEDVEPSTWAAASEGRQYSAVQLQAAYQRIVAGAGQIPAWWAAGWDLLVTPTLAQLPPPIDLSPDAVRGTFGMLTLPYNFTGQPAISLPLAWSRSGLPIGVQLVAAYGQEALLFRVAAQLMAVQPWEHRWPTLPD